MTWTTEDYEKALPFFMRWKFVSPRKLAKLSGIKIGSASKLIHSLNFKQWSDHVKRHSRTVYVVPTKYRK